MESQNNEENESEEKKLNIWGATTTSTSNINSCKEALKDFLENYDQIIKINKPVMKFFNKNYKHIIDNLMYKFNDIYKDAQISKKTNIHFRIYPFWEYLALLGETEKEDEINETNTKSEINEAKAEPKTAAEKMKVYDYSIFVKLLKQLIIILKYNIKKKRKAHNNPEKKKKFWENIQITPILGEKLDKNTTLEALKQYRGEMNIMVIELLEVSEVFCFIIPEEEDKQIRFTNNKENLTFKKMEDQLLIELQKQKDCDKSNILSQIKKFVPCEFLPFVESLKNASTKKEEDVNDCELLECIYMQKEFKLEINDWIWKVDKFFLLEYYLMIQISRMAKIISKTFKKFEFSDYYKEIKENVKKIKTIMNDLNKDKKDLVHDFFLKVNYNYVALMFWIGDEDFMKNLIIFDQEFRVLMKPKDFPKEMSPLSLFYIFLTKIQGEIDESDLYKRFPTTKVLETGLDLSIYQEIDDTSENIEKCVCEFIEKTIFDLLKEDNSKFFSSPGVSNEKNVYSIEIHKIIVKYESSIHKESYLDVKQFLLMIEFNKNPISITLKIKLIDFFMTIENSDELIFFIQTITSRFAEVSVDIDEARRIIIKTNINHQNSLPSFFKKIIEKIDFLLIISTAFYNVCIRTMFYYKATKEIIKYPIFVNIMKNLAKFHENELNCLFPEIKIK